MKLNTLSPEVIALIEKRLNDEYYAHYFYASASNYCRNVGFTGGAEYFKKESDSELEHARGLEKYLTDWNISPKMYVIETPESFTGLVDIIKKAYDLEYGLFVEYDKSSREIFAKDLSTFDFLQKYRIIQTESVAEYSTFLNQLDLIDDGEKFDLFWFDQEVLGGS